MRLWLTVTGPLACDLEVTAAEGTCLKQVREELHRATDPVAPPDVISCGDDVVPDSAILGVPPLIHGALLRLGPAEAADSRAGLLEVRVVGGPDAGGVFRLGAGAAVIGRDPAAVIGIDDPDVSRSHALLTVSAAGVAVQDLDSTNGTSIDGRPITSQPEPLAVGALLRVGESTLTLTTPDDPPVAVRGGEDGFLKVNPPPRLVPPGPDVEIGLPAAPKPPDNPRFPVIMMVLPLLIGVVMVRVMGSWTFALLMVVSPLMLGANAISDRVGGRRGFRRARAEYLRARVRAQVEIDAAVAEEGRRRRHAHPDAAALFTTAQGPGRRLWQRRAAGADALTLRLGTATLPAEVAIQHEASAERVRHPDLPFAPVVVSLREVGVLGLAGPPARVAGLARSAVAQLAAMHSPRDLALVILCDPGEGAGRWHWARWLPHLRPGAGEACSLLVGFSAEQVNARIAELETLLDAGTEGQVGRCTVLVLDGARGLRSVPGVARLLEHGPGVGVYAVCLDADPLELPQECGATAVIGGDVGTRLTLTRAGHQPVTDAVADVVSDAWAQRFARALAPLRDATPQTGQAAVPASARLLDLIAMDPPDAERIAAGWRAGAGSTTALLGSATDGPFGIDLRRDGPHALVAGTTGAGKSELLQTLVASLALGNRPDQMSFVLVDYKGGAAFADCARLPHTVGMVTDLDGHLTRRALSSLDAELKRRERILSAAGCKDIEDYVLAGSPSGPVPRLVMVIDEFASLVNELPDFVTGLVDIARRGRSLGVHLVLATQRPAGVVSAAIRANTNLRIALRVTDPAESLDVVDTKDAALISRATPGRAVCRTGAGGVVAFQGARVGGRPPRELLQAPCVRIVDWTATGDPRRPSETPEDDGPSDLSLLVEAVQKAARALNIAAPASPWLPPLPECVVLDTLEASGPHRLPLGLLDLPAEQARVPFELDLAGGGHLLVVGGPRSGRTTLLRTVAGAAARWSAADLHLYALDCAGGGLAPVAALPHAGAVVARDDVERGDRLLSRLAAEVSRRQQLLGRAGFGSLGEQRAAAGAAERLPWMLLLVDGWEGFVAGYDTMDTGRPVQTLLGLLREGPAVGLRAVVAGDRSALTGRVASLMPGRVVLQMPDPMDYSLAGLTARQLPESWPPGRGLIPGETAHEVQVALLSAIPTGPAQVAAFTHLAEQASKQGPPPLDRPLRVDSLPEHVALDELVAACAPAESPLWVPIGVGGDELAVVGVDLAEDGPAFVIAGPARSGRTTALVTMATWFVRRQAAVLAVTPRRSALRDVPGLTGLYGPQDADDLRRAGRTTQGPMVVIVDDAETLVDTPAGDELCDILQRARNRLTAVIVAGAVDDIAGSYRGIAAEARKNKVGLLLNPRGPIDGDALGVRLSRGIDPRPGRGLFCVRGAALLIHVANSAPRQT